MTKQIDDRALGRLLCELLELHWQACDNSHHASFEIEGYEADDLASIENVAGDSSHLHVTTQNGREFRIIIAAA